MNTRRATFQRCLEPVRASVWTLPYLPPLDSIYLSEFRSYFLFFNWKKNGFD
jgi:hypothetical protein